MILKNNKGDVFEDFIDVKENKISQFLPLTHSVAVVIHDDKHLLVFNKQKEHWELPGGLIDKGESPSQCAIRETKEESNQEILDIKFLGIMKFELQPDYRIKVRRVEFGTLYFGKIKELGHFEKNPEISKICFWDGKENIGTIHSIDLKILELTKKRITSCL
ncbi:NUDIX hydrolase [Seonamhaeicola sp. MEBiC1930]|uniref:NUDIX hydrolase n=1 Tax=Seonamhaeicola sp. MEBiC01930 TaxID=2976768 RepID=UPI00324BB1A3